MAGASAGGAIGSVIGSRTPRAGLFWGLAASLAYAATNLTLRAVALDAEALVGALLRAIPMCLLSWAVLIARGELGAVARLDRRAFLALALIGLVLHVLGNGSFQMALAMVGVSVTVPAAMSALLWGGAGAGWLLLRERVSARAAAGLFLLMIALPLLTSGGGGGIGPVWLGALAAVVAGLSYGSGNALMRHTIVGHTLSQWTALVPMTSVAVVGLAALVLVAHGPSAITDLDAGTAGWLLLAGCMNAAAYMSLSRSLTLLPVARANALSTLQSALSALGGVLMFAEPLTGLVAAGLVLSLAGAVLSQQARPSPKRAEPVAGTRSGESAA